MKGSVRNAEAGITLIEVLVVLAVIGVGAGATMMATRDRGRDVEAEAMRLARHLTLGVDEVLISGLPMVLRWDAAGYGFGQLPAEMPLLAPHDWPAAAHPALGARHALPDAVALRLRDAALPVPVVLPASAATRTVTFDLTGAAAGWVVIFDGFTARAVPEGGA